MKIIMTPEEKFNKNVGYVLQKIKERELYTKEGQPILYGVTPSELFGVGISHEEEIEVLEKLQERGAIKNLKETEEWNVFSLEIIQPKFDKFCKKREEIDKKLEGIDENPWLSKESKTIQRKKLLKGRQKQSKESKINLPTDQEVIEEYLNILNRIEKERQRTPKGEPIAFPIPKGVLYAKGVPLPEQETSILRIFEQDGIIQITEKTIPIIDEFDPYENSETIRAVKIPDLDKFKNYRDKLSELKNQLSKRLKEKRADAETRAEEIRRQFEELGEKQKALDELGKQIYSRIQKDFSAPFQYFKYHEEVSKKISEQLAPLKDTLERVGRAQQTVKISLTPALQRLAPSLKQLEEQIKHFNELYKAPDHSLSEAIISPDLIRVQQGAEMISELREVRKLIEKSAITKDEPIPIKGEIKIEGLKEGLEAIAKTKKEEDKNKFPYKLPAGTVWENIIFQFLDDEKVFIKVKQHRHYTDYKEMRLVGKGKNPNPSELWTFLKVLALENGEIPIDNLKRETKYKKQKELLSKFLQFYFEINLDPFYPYKPYPPYKHERSYKIRMTLIPPPQSAKKQNEFNEEDKNDLGIEEDYKQQTPEIYDKNQ